MDTYDGENMEIVVPPVLDDGERKLVLVTHDETTFDSNDGKRKVWIESGKQHLRPKGAGKSIMVSQFMCLCHGHMEVEVTEDILNRYPALKAPVGSVAATLRTIKPGKNSDGWWSNQDLVDQLKQTIIVFEILHPDCVALFAFDNSSNHHKFAPDALKARYLNKSDGGKNVPLLRPGWFLKDGSRVVHTMQVSSNGQLKQKGIQRILQERGLWNCNMQLAAGRQLLDEQPDFASQKEWLEETVSAQGHRIIFYPKFHPEFNWIEMFWGSTKRYTRKHCTYKFKDLENMIPIALKVTSLSSMRKFARKCFRYIDIYASGVQLTPKQIEHAMKKYSSHRRIPASLLESL